MHARIASGILLALGAIDLGAQNLALIPRLTRGRAAPIASAQRAVEPARAAEPQALPAAVTLHAVTLASIDAARPEGALRAAPDVQFSLDSAKIERAAACTDLQRLARELAETKGRQILLRGHSDRLGPPGRAVELSGQRAAAVARHLIWRGVRADRITIEAVGASEPADPADTPAAWARNRRVEILWR